RQKGEVRKKRQDVADHQQPPGVAGRGDHAIGRVRGQGDRFFDQDVLTGLEGGDRHWLVLHRRRADVYEVDVGIREEVGEAFAALDRAEVHLPPGRAEIAVNVTPVAGPFLRVAAADRGHGRAAQVPCGQKMDVTHEADAGEADADHWRTPVSGGRAYG